METANSHGRLVTNDGRSSPAEYISTHPSSAVRTQKAVKIFAIWFAIAVACVFIPILHFVLVPGALLAGGFLSFKAFRETHVYENIKGICPACQKPLEIEKIRADSNLKEICPHCRFGLKFSPTP